MSHGSPDAADGPALFVRWPQEVRRFKRYGGVRKNLDRHLTTFSPPYMASRT